VDPVTALLVAARDGDEAAFEALVRATQAEVWRFCAGMVGRAGADEATQETFVRAWRSAHTFRAESSARTWLLTLARRASAAHLTSARRAPSPVEEVPPGRPAGDPGDGVAVDDLIGRLEPDRRAAFVLTQVLGLGYAEAAAVCGCPIGTVRSRVARARDDLIESLAEPAPGASPPRP
jgi:RNA polymerase sigma-70 factor (ECF subfamily)